MKGKIKDISYRMCRQHAVPSFALKISGPRSSKLEVGAVTLPTLLSHSRCETHSHQQRLTASRDVTGRSTSGLWIAEGKIPKQTKFGALKVGASGAAEGEWTQPESTLHKYSRAADMFLTKPRLPLQIIPLTSLYGCASNLGHAIFISFHGISMLTRRFSKSFALIVACLQLAAATPSRVYAQISMTREPKPGSIRATRQFIATLPSVWAPQIESLFDHLMNRTDVSVALALTEVQTMISNAMSDAKCKTLAAKSK